MKLIDVITGWFKKKKPTPAPTPTPVKPTVNGILLAHNQLRLTNGRPIFVLNTKLSLAAQSHSDYMSKTNILSHTGERGSDISLRAHQVGYVFSHLGENIAMTQPDVNQVMNVWMNSAGHRTNILNPNYVDIGIGISEAGGMTFWCVMFGRV